MYKHKCTEWFLNEEGYLEKSAAAYKENPNILYEKTAGAGSDNYTKYGKEMHDVYPAVMDFPAYWCDAFVDDGFYNTYGVANAKGLLGGNFDDYTKNSINLYKSKNAFYLAKEITPEEGDQIFFTRNTKFDGVHHTGYVWKVENGRVYTIEGNTSDGKDVIPNGGKVCSKNYSLSDSRIYGYGRPKYSLYEKEPEKKKEYYEPGDDISATELVFKDRTLPVLAELKITNDGLRIREKPDFNTRDVWFKTNLGYISAYRVTGWVKEVETAKWFYLKNDFQRIKGTEEVINGLKYGFDSQGYLWLPRRLNSDGVVID